MSVVLRKEIRLLQPAWIVAMVAATVPMWLACLPGLPDADFVTLETTLCSILITAGALLLSLSSFGSEMTLGTFPSLLAQPRPRLDIWQMKIGVLAAALASVAVASVFSLWLLSGATLAESTRWRDYLGYILLLIVVAFAGGLWASLLFRQMVAAFWFAIVVPFVLYSAFSALIEGRLVEDSSFLVACLALTTCIYAAVGYALARWLFFHAQDKQAQGGADTGRWSFLPAFPRPRWPVAALLVKELRLQQGTLLIAIVLLLLNLSALAVSEYYVALTSDYFSLNWMLWLIVPLVVGCASVAEERRGLTIENALCLPMGRLRQFAIKLVVVFGLGIFLGAVMPWLLEQLHTVHGSDNPTLNGLLIAAAMTTLIGCYASTLSSALLQAVGAAIGLFLISIVFALLCFPIRMTFECLPWLSWTVLIATLSCLSYSNCKQLRITWRRWLRNGIVLLAVVVIYCLIADAIIYLYFPDIINQRFE